MSTKEQHRRDAMVGETSPPPDRRIAAVASDQRSSPWEVEASDLTADVLRRGLAAHGSLLVRGLLDMGAVDRLVFDIDHAFAGARAVENGASSDETAPWYAPFVPDEGPGLDADRRMIEAADCVFAVDSPRTLFDLVEICERAGLRALVTEFFGERPVLTAKKTTLRRVKAESLPPWWHQDGAFLGQVGALNIWFALSRCGVDAPSLDVVHMRVDELWASPSAHFRLSLGDELVQERAAGNVVRLVFEPGDALLFDELLVHRTGTSPGMPNVRYAIETWFFRPAAAPLDRVPLVF